MKKTILVLVGLLLASSAAFADTQYNNTSQVNFIVYSFGNPNSATFGETFSAPLTDTILNDFSLFLSPSDSSGQLEGYVGTWTGSEVGSILYTSLPVTVNGVTEFTFNTGGLSLIAGDEYVAFISISEPSYSSYSGTTTIPSVAAFPPSIPGGSAVYLSNSNDISQFTSGNNWGEGSGVDSEFIADFSLGASPTPEPSSLLLFGTGLTGFAGALRRKFAR